MPSGAKPEAEAAPDAVAAEGPASGGPVAAEKGQPVAAQSLAKCRVSSFLNSPPTHLKTAF